MLSKKHGVQAYFFIIIATVLLYIWQLHLYPMINPDGVTYLEAAAAYASGGLHAALALDDQARWPFYSILIGEVHNITHLTVYAAQRLLDGIMIAMSAALFLYVVRLFAQHPWSSVSAIIVWLAWHEYIKWWPIVIRDQGFMLSLLSSFCCYYFFIVTKRFLWAIAWFLSLSLAELFRIEAVMFLTIVPLSVFFLTEEKFLARLYLWLKLNVFILLALIFILALFAMQVLSVHSFRFAYMWQEISLYIFTTKTEFLRRYDIIRHTVFFRENPFPGYALLGAYITLFLCFLMNQIGFAVVFSLLWIGRVWRQLQSKILCFCFMPYAFVALLLPALFFAEYAFLNGRYLLAFGLFTMLLTASALPHVIDSFSGKRRGIVVSVVGLLFLLNFIASLFSFGHRTDDEMKIGLWLNKHYPEKTIFTDTRRILFYASTPPDYKHGAAREMWLHDVLGTGEVWLREHDSWCQYDLLVLAAPPGQTEGEYQVFSRLHRHGMIGPMMHSFKRKSTGDEILVAPILHRGCYAFVQKSIKNS